MYFFIIMIKFLVGILLAGSFFILFIPKHQYFLIRFVGNSVSFFTFFVSLFLWVLFDDSTPKLQFVEEIVWLSQSNINFTLGIDGISIFFLLLTTLLIPICLLASCSIDTCFFCFRSTFILYFL